jgi:acetolactate synthase-1/3 small subunit
LIDILENDEQDHTFSVLVENEAGVLARVIGLLSGRGYNIESLTVAEVDKDKHLSKITIVSSGTKMVLEQIRTQLERLVPVQAVANLTVDGPSLERELALIKVVGGDKTQAECLKVANTFQASIIESTPEYCIFEVIEGTEKMNTFINLMKPLGLVDVSRSGVVAMPLGSEAI